MLENSYSEPQIYGKTTEQEWFVGFKFYCAKRGASKRSQVRLGINYHNTVEARACEAKNVKSLVIKCLADGWNPFDGDVKAFLQRQLEEEATKKEAQAKKDADHPRNYGLVKALNWAFSKKAGNKKSTRAGLKITIGHFTAAADSLGFSDLPVRDVTRFHICEILDRIMDQRQAFYNTSTDPRYKGKIATPNLYNVLLDRISNLLFEFDNRGIIEFNPCHKIAKKEEIDFGVHRHATEEEEAIVKRELPARHQGLYDIMRFIYVTGMRIDEIMDTRFDMVDFRSRCINLSENPYNAAGELISKTTAYRQVPVPEFFLAWIRERSEGCPPTDYIFSRKFKPGPYRITAQWVSMSWKAVVRDGLGINVSIYSFKGLGGEAKRAAGIELPAVSGGYGHTSTTLARKIYLSREGERLRQQVIEKTPDL